LPTCTPTMQHFPFSPRVFKYAVLKASVKLGRGSKPSPQVAPHFPNETLYVPQFHVLSKVFQLPSFTKKSLFTSLKPILRLKQHKPSNNCAAHNCELSM
jgi:hypothetical protein